MCPPKIKAPASTPAAPPPAAPAVAAAPRLVIERKNSPGRSGSPSGVRDSLRITPGLNLPKV